MRKFFLCKELLDEIASRQDTVVIIRKFYELYGTVNDNHRASLRRLLLTAATEHDHTELRIYLTANARYDSQLMKSGSISESKTPQESYPSSEEVLPGTLEEPSISSPGSEEVRSESQQDESTSIPRSKPRLSCSLKDVVVFILVAYLRGIVMLIKWILILFLSSLRSETIVCDSLQDTPSSSSRSEEIISISDSCRQLREAKSSKQACSLAEEIVEQLMSEDADLNQKGIRRLLLETNPDTFKHERGNRNPLLIILTLLEDCYYEQRSLSLPDIVQLMIKAGANVDDHVDDLTALNYLTSRVMRMWTDDHDIAMKGNSMIVDIAHILLEAGSDPNGFVANAGLIGPGICQPLDHLVRVIGSRPINHPDRREDEYGFLMLLASKLIELIMMHKAKPRQWFWNVSHVQLFEMATMLSEAYEWIADRPGYVNFCNNVLDSCGNIRRCFWLREVAFTVTSVVSKDDADENDFVNNFVDTSSYDDEDDFVDNFVETSSYSSPCRPSHDRSTKLICHLLDTMSTSQIGILKRILSKRLESMTELSSEELRDILVARNEPFCDISLSDLHIYTQNALAWVCEREKSFNLQHFARLAIIRAMRPQCWSDVSTLGLPKHLERFVLFKID